MEDHLRVDEEIIHLKNFDEFINEGNKKETYDYGCVMLYFKFTDLKTIQKKIDKKDLYKKGNKYGFETEPHVTLLYGLHSEEIADKKAILDEKNKLDTNAGPEALLKQFAVKEGSSLIPKNKEPATAKAETTKKELEAKGEEKTAAEKKAAEEKAKAEEKSKEDSKKEPPSKPATQESAESLLASLNTKMTELIKINKGTQAVNEQQLSVQKGMTSDLFAA
jgi:hypothetical protein